MIATGITRVHQNSGEFILNIEPSKSVSMFILFPANRSRQTAGEVVPLSIGDAYQRAALGIAEESDDEAFAQQIEAAVTHGYGRPA
jgi:hypothetical protein